MLRTIVLRTIVLRTHSSARPILSCAAFPPGKATRPRTRTWNLRLRRPTPCPLGQGGGTPHARPRSRELRQLKRLSFLVGIQFCFHFRFLDIANKPRDLGSNRGLPAVTKNVPWQRNSPHWGLNPGPSVYKTDSLPLSYRGYGIYPYSLHTPWQRTSLHCGLIEPRTGLTLCH